MTIINSYRLQPSDLRHLGHDLLASVRLDRAEWRSAVNRSLALHHEALDEDEAVALAFETDRHRGEAPTV